MSVASHSSISLLALALAFSGCGGAERRVTDATEARATARVAVLPSTWATEASVAGIDPGRSLARGLAGAQTLEVVQGPAVERSLGARDADCAEDPSCIREVGRELGVDRVAAVSLAGLGATVMIRVRMVEIESGAAETSRQRVVQDASAESVEAATFAIGEELAPAPPPAAPEQRWYERWWVWTIVAVAIGAGVATAIVVSQDGGQSPDFVVTPP